ncbi:MAG: DUF551 domain-containing protein [Lutibacter sp.]|uniref:DUF551 domain-containing protein n=1 Tax=Lutibacter sp. TaxID=1925666 RepID=UPI0019EAB5E3|nr:DUF551 domain-containing protein [Lutibacter sp.]NOR27635.1 DUF551 domain-containing protein [Lutibacter sp.]
MKNKMKYCNCKKDGWISVNDRLPVIPEKRYSVSVFVTYYCCEDEPNETSTMLWDGKDFKQLMVGKGFFDYKPCFGKVNYWMYLPKPAEV